MNTQRAQAAGDHRSRQRGDDGYGVLTEPATLVLTRLLPGPVERVWSYLTQSDLRRRWFAAGDMEMRVGAPFELVWRNNELTDPPGKAPDGFGDEHKLETRITELDPPHRMSFPFGNNGDVTFDLEPQGDEVLLTITHRRLPNPAVTLNVSAGWHAHVDILEATLRGDRPEPFWDRWASLKGDYENRLPAA